MRAWQVIGSAPYTYQSTQVYQTSVLALVQIGALGIWGIATGIILLRARPTEVRT